MVNTKEFKRMFGVAKDIVVDDLKLSAASMLGLAVGTVAEVANWLGIACDTIQYGRSIEMKLEPGRELKNVLKAIVSPIGSSWAALDGIIGAGEEIFTPKKKELKIQKRLVIKRERIGKGEEEQVQKKERQDLGQYKYVFVGFDETGKNGLLAAINRVYDLTEKMRGDYIFWTGQKLTVL